MQRTLSCRCWQAGTVAARRAPGPPGRRAIDTYLALLTGGAAQRATAPRPPHGSVRSRCGRALRTIELRRAFAQGNGDPVLMNMVRASTSATPPPPCSAWAPPSPARASDMRARPSPLAHRSNYLGAGHWAANLGTIGPTTSGGREEPARRSWPCAPRRRSGELKRHEQEAQDRAAYAVNNPRLVDGLRRPKLRARSTSIRASRCSPTSSTARAGPVPGGNTQEPAGGRLLPSKHLLFFDARDPPGSDQSARTHQSTTRARSNRSSWAAATWT